MHEEGADGVTLGARGCGAAVRHKGGAGAGHGGGWWVGEEGGEVWRPTGWRRQGRKGRRPGGARQGGGGGLAEG
jgi:hypothetical protein